MCSTNFSFLCGSPKNQFASVRTKLNEKYQVFFYNNALTRCLDNNLLLQTDFATIKTSREVTLLLQHIHFFCYSGIGGRVYCSHKPASCTTCRRVKSNAIFARFNALPAIGWAKENAINFPSRAKLNYLCHQTKDFEWKMSCQQKETVATSYTRKQFNECLMS